MLACTVLCAFPVDDGSFFCVFSAYLLVCLPSTAERHVFIAKDAKAVYLRSVNVAVNEGNE